MPTIVIREIADVPRPSKANPASLEQQRVYEGFIRDIGNSNVGELELSEGEQIRSIKVRLTRAAKRLNTELQIWDADGKVYFKNADFAPAAKRGRPKKS